MTAHRLLAAAFAVCVALLAVSSPVQAHGRVRGSVTFHLGYPWPGYWWGPGYWGPGYVYPPAIGYYPRVYGPPVVVAPPEPPVYIERDAPETAPPAPVWWYWCPSANAYYPYVKDCPGGWQRVPPQPVPPAQQGR